MKNLILPMIRVQLPKLLASEIVGIKPMFKDRFNKTYWPYQHYVDTIPYEMLYEIERWCWKNFKGKYWRNQGRYYAFKRKQDYAWFMLRWG